MLSHPDDLKDRVVALLGDVGPLHTVSAIGFNDPDLGRVWRALEHLAGEPGWSFLDLRSGTDEETAQKLRQSSAEDVLVIAVRAQTPPPSLLKLATAYVEG